MPWFLEITGDIRSSGVAFKVATAQAILAETRKERECQNMLAMSEFLTCHE